MRIPIIIVASCLILLFAGFLFPHSLTWGFHFVGFLPPFVFFGLIIAALVTLFLLHNGMVDTFLEMLARFVSEKSVLFLTLVCVLFSIVAYFIRVEIPLLGDSFLLLNNFIYTFSGDHPLYLHRSPLSFGYFFAIASLLNTTTFPDLMDAFLFGEIILGIVFIISVFYITKELFSKNREQVLSFAFLLTLPFMQLYFGYAELYAAILTGLSLFTLVSVLYLNKKIPFYCIPPVYLLLYSTNYLNIIMLPALLFTMTIEFIRGKKINIFFGILFAVILLTGLFALVNFDVKRLFQAAEHGHMLSFRDNPGDQFQAYSLFSPFHGIDLLNIVFLLGFSALLLVVLYGIIVRKMFTFDEPNAFFTSSLVLFFGFLLVVKLDLGFPKDWDILAPYFFLVNLFAIKLFLQSEIPSKMKIAGTIIVVTLLTSVPWFLVNASPQPALKRAESLLDTRITSPSGMYQSMFHISMYYHYTERYEEQIELWEQYTESYSYDWKGFQNLAKSYYEAGEQFDSLTMRAYWRWIQIDSVNGQGKIDFANFLSERALKQYARRNYSLAEPNFRQAISLNPKLKSAYNNLASLYLDIKMPDSAIAFCKQALEQNPGYITAYQNLANAYAQKSEFDTAIAYYQKVISLDPNSISAYENMSRAYYQKGEKENAVNTLRQAARLGSQTAQSLLRMSGEQW